MLICGPCLCLDENDYDMVLNTAKDLVGVATYYRCKIYGGGSNKDIWHPGIGNNGIPLLKRINDTFIRTGTEVQLSEHIDACKDLSFLWIGARSAANYGLLQVISRYSGEVMVKRNPGMSIDELIGIYDIMKYLLNKDIYVIERGVNSFDRKPERRWRPDIIGSIEIKDKRPDIFQRYIVDCSHSCFDKNYVEDVYKAFKAVGVQHFMFEAYSDPEKTRTDKAHAISVERLKDIII